MKIQSVFAKDMSQMEKWKNAHLAILKNLSKNPEPDPYANDLKNLVSSSLSSLHRHISVKLQTDKQTGKCCIIQELTSKGNYVTVFPCAFNIRYHHRHHIAVN